jgi:hypothetical protein
MCVKIIVSQALATWYKSRWKSYNALHGVYRWAVNMSVQMSLYIYSINIRFHTAALSGNVIFCNQIWSAMGEFITFIRHIGGSTWCKRTLGAWQPVVTSHHAPHISQCPKKFLQEAQISSFLIWWTSFTNLQQCNLSVSDTDG